MRARVTSTTTGATLLESVRVVTTHDGRLGFVTTTAKAEALRAAHQVTLSVLEHSVSGVAVVVRSGTAFEEVRGRTRMSEGVLARLVDRLTPRRPTAVVLVTPGR